jgi:flagellar basal-body rod modification protein FlgD
MTVSAAVAPTSTDTSTTSGSRTRLAENFDTFLTLLTTQLKNQDPLSPMDSNAFTQQMVQMTGVEQQLLTNDLLKQLVGNNANGVSTAVSLIGKDVKAVSDDAAINNKEAKWTYKLDAEAAKTKIEVIDSAGKVVHAETVDPKADDKANKAGDHDFVWNGKDVTGKQLSDGGVYTLKITATDVDGKTIGSTSYVKGVVTGVEQANGATYVTINGGKVVWDKVTSIAQPATPAPPTTTSDNTTDDTNNQTG